MLSNGEKGREPNHQIQTLARDYDDANFFTINISIHQPSIMSHCQSLRIALYRVFVRPALLNPTIPCLLPSSAYQSYSNSTLQRPPVEPSTQNSTSSNEPPKKRSYKDRAADKEAARSPFAT